MHWLASNWFTVMAVVYAITSEVMPLLPNKAKTVVGAILEVGRALAAKAGKQLPAVKSSEEEPK